METLALGDPVVLQPEVKKRQRESPEGQGQGQGKAKKSKKEKKPKKDKSEKVCMPHNTCLTLNKPAVGIKFVC